MSGRSRRMKGDVEVHLGRRADGKKWSVMIFASDLDSRDEAESLVPLVKQFLKDHLRHGMAVVPFDQRPPEGTA
jgi:hypothetical protein